MRRNKLGVDLRVLFVALVASLSLQVSAKPATGKDFFFPVVKMEFSGLAMGADGSPLYIEDEIDIRFEQARCGFAISSPQKGLTEWMFALYEVIRQGNNNVRLAALPSMMTKGIIANAAEELEPGNLEYSDKRWNPTRPVRLVYGPISQEELTEKEAAYLGGEAPNRTKFMGSDYFVAFRLPHLENSSGIRDVAFVIYFKAGEIQGFEYRLVAKASSKVDTKSVPMVRYSIAGKTVGLEEYFTFMTCR